jgi:siroheme synthase-like protein
VLVVGGGRVAARKVADLVACGAQVTVVAPSVDDAVLGHEGVAVERRPYRAGEAAAYRLVVTATGDRAVDQQVFDDAEAAGVWVNSADDPARCTFTLPAVVRRHPVVVAVATGGHSPALATWLRRRLEAELGPEVAVLAGLLDDARSRVKASGRSTEALDWQSLLDGGLLDVLVAEGEVAARARIDAWLEGA